MKSLSRLWKNSTNTKGELRNWVQQVQGHRGGSLPVIVGLVDPRNRDFVATGREFLYGDHAYFQRGWTEKHFRLVRSAHHLTTVLERPDDRLQRWAVTIEPWRKRGRAVVVIPPSPYYVEIYRLQHWLPDTLAKLARVTDRPVHVKASKGRLRECLLDEQDAWAVVCCMSVAGMEAALMGVPVFSTPHCCSWPVNAGTLDDIERPAYPERHPWACSLAYASWSADELLSIDFRDYRYSLLEGEGTCAS